MMKHSSLLSIGLLSVALTGCDGKKEPETIPAVPIGDRVSSVAQSATAPVATAATQPLVAQQKVDCTVGGKPSQCVVVPENQQPATQQRRVAQATGPQGNCFDAAGNMISCVPTGIGQPGLAPQLVQQQNGIIPCFVNGSQVACVLVPVQQQGGGFQQQPYQQQSSTGAKVIIETPLVNIMVDNRPRETSYSIPGLGYEPDQQPGLVFDVPMQHRGGCVTKTHQSEGISFDSWRRGGIRVTGGRSRSKDCTTRTGNTGY